MTTLELISKMAEIYWKRRDRYNTIVVDKFPPIARINEPIIVGTFVWTFPRSKVRLILEEQCVDIGFGAQASTEVVRDYIEAKFPKPFRAYNGQIAAINVKRSPVLFAKPGRIVDGVYLDIKSAYWTLTRYAGIDLDYWPDRWIGHGQNCDDFPLADNKIARSSIVSQGLVRPMRMWDGSKMYDTKPKGGKHVNQALWAFVQDTLHAIANALYETCDLRYANTDGFIVPGHALSKAEGIFRAWGVPYGIKARGWAFVHGLASYTVGTVQTKHIIRSGDDTIRSNICERVDRSYLEERVRALSDLRARQAGSLH